METVQGTADTIPWRNIGFETGPSTGKQPFERPFPSSEAQLNLYVDGQVILVLVQRLQSSA